MWTLLPRLVLVVISTFVTLCAAAAHADVTVKATADPMHLFLGDTFVLQITVEGASAASEPDLTKLPDLECKFVGGQDRSSRNISIINGRRSEQVFQGYVMQWRVRPLKAGKLKVPSVSVQVNGVSHATNELLITVREPVDNTDFKLRLISERTTAYVGEPIPMKLVWYIGREVEPAVFTGFDGGDAFDIVPSADVKARADQRNNPRSPYRNVQFAGGAAVGVLGQGVYEGRSFTTLSIEFSIIPKRPGEIEIGPYSAAFDATTGPFRSERVVIASQRTTLRVSTLPEQGRPVGFSGLIGRFTIEASAGVTDANVGDPVPLTITVRGAPPMERVKAPELELIPSFVSGFKGSPDGWDQSKDVAPTERVFTTTIRPKSDEVTEVPSIPLSFFDTETGTYRTVVTPPIPLKVRPTREVTAADAVVGSKSIAGPATYVLTPGGAAMRQNYTGDDLLRNQRLDALAVLTSPAGLGIVLTPPCALAALIVLRHFRSRSIGTNELVRRAAIHARADALRAESPAEVGQAIHQFVSELGGTPANAVTSQDVRRLVTIDAEHALKLALCLERCESERYGAVSDELVRLRDESVAVLDTIAHARKGGSR